MRASEISIPFRETSAAAQKREREEAISSWERAMPDIPTHGVFVRLYRRAVGGKTEFSSPHRKSGKKMVEQGFRSKRKVAEQVMQTFAAYRRGVGLKVAVVDRKSDEVLWIEELT